MKLKILSLFVFSLLIKAHLLRLFDYVCRISAVESVLRSFSHNILSYDVSIYMIQIQLESQK